MVVASIVVITIIVFVVVDLVLRMLLNRAREARLKREREQALDIGLKLDVSDEAATLKRVELDDPTCVSKSYPSFFTDLDQLIAG